MIQSQRKPVIPCDCVFMFQIISEIEPFFNDGENSSFKNQGHRSVCFLKINPGMLRYFKN